MTMTSMKAWPLVLLSFSLVSMGKECQNPVMNGKIVLSSESILKNEFPDNSVAVVECAKGYEPKEGSTSITCMDGNWSPVELICEKIDCGAPIPSAHMTYSIQEGTLFGAFVQPDCETGYELEGTTHRQCLVTGWSGKAECKLTTCDEPDVIAYGEVKITNSVIVFDDVIEYTCHENYTLVGNRSITCGEYGVYSSPPPQCKAIECTVPEIRFGKQTEGNPPYLYKSQATFECWPGYRMKGLATSVCEESGWSALPVCVEVIITKTEASFTKSEDTTATASTHLREGHEEAPISHSQRGKTVIIASVAATTAVILFISWLLYRNTKHKGPNNRTAPLL